MNHNPIPYQSPRTSSSFLRRLIYAFFAFLSGALFVSATTLNPVADTYVRSGGSAGNNYGTSSSMEIRANGSAWRTSFLKFDISGISGTVTSATLRICANTSGSTQTTGVFEVADTSWSESTMTYNNQPSIGSQLDDVEITTSSYAWYELDVTSFIASEVAASSSLVSLCLENTDDAVAVNKVRTKEASYTQWPELVITISTAVAPTITSQPSDLTTDYGETATFSVTATGSPSPTYQWRKDSANLVGAVSSNLSIPNALEADAGDYDVVITNSAGSVTSSTATLDFNPPVLPLIDEDFSLNASDFTEVAGGSWSISSGRYLLSSPVNSGVNGILGNISVHDTVLLDDYSISSVISVTGTASSWDDIALVFGYQDEDNYYYVSLNESNDAYTKGLFKVVGGSPSELADFGSLSVSSDTDYTIDIERSGSSITVDINSSQVASTTDSTFVGGQIGYGSKNDGGQFDDLLVYGEVGASQVETPAFSPLGGTFSSSQSVSITSATSGASIRYTTDGSDPTSSYGTLYSGAISVSSTTTLRAIAYKSGMINSALNSETYTIIIGTVSTPQFSPAGGTYTSTQNVAISSSTSGATIRYTTDGTTPTSSSGTVYSSPVSIASTATLKAIAYKSGMNDSSVSSALYTISGGGPTKPSALNTGTTGSLTASAGMTITTNGTVIEDLDISGTVRIKANNVTIRNCRIDTAGLYGIQCSYGYTGILIEDCELSGVQSAAIYGGNVTIRRCYIYDCGADAIKATHNYVIESCYFTDLGYTPTAHADGVQMVSGDDGLIRWNTFDMIAGEDGYKNSQCIIIQTNNSPIDNIIIDGNWINGGGYSVQIRDKGNGYGAPTNIQIINNKFGTDAQFGVIIADGSPTISGNTWEATGDPAP